MPDAVSYRSGDSVQATLTFTLAAGEEASRVSVLLTRTQARSEHPAAGRARCLVLESCAITSAKGGAVPRARCQAELSGVVPSSICGGTYHPVFCVFAYSDGRPVTGFEIDADQRFSIEIFDDASAFDAGPAIVELT